jgi:hypothetical protein
MELQAVTGQLYIVNGESQSATAVPGLVAQPSPPKAARGRERDYLFVHLTLSGKLDETAVLYSDLLATVSLQFYQATGSVTAALRKAILAANDTLLRRNLSGSDPIIEGAIVAAVLRHDELFMAQVGDGFAFIGRNFGVERLPPRPATTITPLGRTAGLDFRYFHNRLEEDDNLLLCDPRMGHLSAQDFQGALMEADIEDSLAELSGLVGGDSARLLLIAFSDEPPAYLPEMGQPVTAVTAAVPSANAPRRETTPAVLTGPRRAQLPVPAIDPAQLEHNARRVGSGTARGLARFTGGLADLLSHLREPVDENAPPPTVSDWAWPALAAVLIPILVTVIVTGVYLRWGQVQRFAEIKQEMNQSLVLAAEAGDEATTRSYLQETLILAAEAENLRQGDSEVARLRRQALSRLDLLDSVNRLVARPLHSYAGGAELRTVIVGEEASDGLFVLDIGQDRVYRHQVDDGRRYLIGEPETILFRGQPIVSHLATRVVDMMWRPQGAVVSRSGLAMLDLSGGLITYYPNQGDRRFVPLGLASQWRRPTAIASFSERLYVLDGNAGVVWKYYPDGEGFQLRDGDETINFGRETVTNLDQAVDLAIYSQDGSVLLLYRGGDLRRYGGERLLWGNTELAQNGLTAPMVAPAAVKIIGRGLNASIYVLDPGSGRLLQFSLGGTLLAQYKASDEQGRELLRRAVDFDIVAEPPLRAFIITNNGLYLLTQN